MIKIDTGFGVDIFIDKDLEIVEVTNKLSGDTSRHHGLVKVVMKGGVENGNNNDK